MSLEKRFPSKRAFVTGAASGLGHAICSRLAQHGWKIGIADINTLGGQVGAVREQLFNARGALGTTQA